MAESLAKETTSTEDLKTSTENSDFVIKVEDVSYPVHQNILISSSEYFRGMLTHDTKERQDGFVEIKEIDSKTMKIGIDFMYKGDIDVTMETAKTLLPASKFLLLTNDKLGKQSVDVLKENLYFGNCITVLKLARKYDCSELAEKALGIFKRKFKMENYDNFCKLDKEGLKQHINNLDIEIAWDGIINRIKLDVENRSSDIVEFVKMLNWKIFPSSRFLHSVWSEPLFRSSEFCQNWIFKQLFYDSKDLERKMGIANCLIIDKISFEFDFLSKESEEVIFEFIKTNFVEVSKKCEFNTFSKDKIIDLFRDAENGLCNEIARWNAMITWMKSNREHKEIFPELLKFVNFHELPKDFIKSQIESESLLTEMPHLYGTLLFGMTTHQDDKTHLAVLYPDGKIYAVSEKSLYHLPYCPSDKVNFKTKFFSFRDKLCVLVNGELFYLGKYETKWIPRAELDFHPDQFSTIVCSNDKIYVVEKERMSSYDPDTNTWDESLPGCGLDGKIFAGCTSDWICVRDTDGQGRTYSFREAKWNEIVNNREISTNGAMASYDQKIFVVGVKKPHGYICAECRDNDWKNISDTPVAINNPCHLFFVAEELFLLMSGHLYLYVEICNEWSKHGSFPNIIQCVWECLKI